MSDTDDTTIIVDSNTNNNSTVVDTNPKSHDLDLIRFREGTDPKIRRYITVSTDAFRVIVWTFGFTLGTITFLFQAGVQACWVSLPTVHKTERNKALFLTVMGLFVAMIILSIGYSFGSIGNQVLMLSPGFEKPWLASHHSRLESILHNELPLIAAVTVLVYLGLWSSIIRTTSWIGIGILVFGIAWKALGQSSRWCHRKGGTDGVDNDEERFLEEGNEA